MKNVLQTNFQVTLTSKFLGLSIPSLEFSKLSCQKQVKWHLWSASKKEVHNPYTNASVVICELLISQWPLGHESFLGLIKSFQYDPLRVLSCLTWITGYLIPYSSCQPQDMVNRGLAAWPTTWRQAWVLRMTQETGIMRNRSQAGFLYYRLTSQMLIRARVHFPSVDLKTNPSMFFKYWHHFSLKAHVFSTKHTYQTLPSFSSLFNSRVVYNVSGLQPVSGPL